MVGARRRSVLLAGEACRASKEKLITPGDLAEPAEVSRGHSTLGVMNRKGRPKHQVRDETDASARRTETCRLNSGNMGFG